MYAKLPNLLNWILKWLLHVFKILCNTDYLFTVVFDTIELNIKLCFSYCNAVSLVDLFRYSNMYVCTTKITHLARTLSRYEEVVNAISRPGLLI